MVEVSNTISTVTSDGRISNLSGTGSSGNIVWAAGDPFKVILFYRYMPIDDCEGLLSDWKSKCSELGLLGRILISKEGVNGTLAGSHGAIDAFVQYVAHSNDMCRLIDWKYSFSDDSRSNDALPFLGLSIRVVDEIVSSGAANSLIEKATRYDPASYGGLVGTGTHLTPQQFHDAVVNGKGVVLDIRNEFEHDIGHFHGAVNLKTFTYAETFQALDQVLEEYKIAPETTDSSRGVSGDETINDTGDAKGDAVPDHHISNSNTRSSSDDSIGASVEVEGDDGTVTTSPAAEAEVEVEVEAEGGSIFMYCTGGIRCEKASAYLRAKGYRNVYQLEGGIHRYLEAYPDGGAFHGKNFVFDSRVAVGPSNTTAPPATATQSDVATAAEPSMEANPGHNEFKREEVVGSCIECRAPYDEYSGFIVCTVCRMPVLVCPSCVDANPNPGEYHCHRHRDLKECYFTVLSKFSCAALERQRSQLLSMLSESLVYKSQIQQRLRDQRRQYNQSKVRVKIEDDDSASKQVDEQHNFRVDSFVNDSEAIHANALRIGRHRRRTLRRQIDRIEEQLKQLESCRGDDQDEVPNVDCINLEDEKGCGGPMLDTSHSCSSRGVASVDNPQIRGRWGFWQS